MSKFIELLRVRIGSKLNWARGLRCFEELNIPSIGLEACPGVCSTYIFHAGLLRNIDQKCMVPVVFFTKIFSLFLVMRNLDLDPRSRLGLPKSLAPNRDLMNLVP
jgi:hypothetical protein